MYYKYHYVYRLQFAKEKNRKISAMVHIYLTLIHIDMFKINNSDCSSLLRGVITVFDCILRVQKGDEEAFFTILKQFDKLLWKYSYKSNMEADDMHSELMLKLYLLLMNFDINKFEETDDPEKFIIGYILRSIRNAFINLNKKATHTKRYESVDTTKVNIPYEEDYHTTLEVNELLSILSDTEYEVIDLIFFYGLSATEVAKLKNVSPQAVNQLKLRSLRKMRGG